MRVDVPTVVEFLGLACLITGGFLLGFGEGVVAIGAALLYEVRS